ncbi:hypothetical protein [Pseudonocardia xishanensis]|uniref:Uncharacterized protein n=1 Tax=Pseudonocardia xishanensis TaxID=630995 RepID=A0ABP8RVI3_9PSEU
MEPEPSEPTDPSGPEDGSAAVLAALYDDGDRDEIVYWTVQERRRGRAAEPDPSPATTGEVGTSTP